MFLVSRNKKLYRAYDDCEYMYATLNKDYYYHYHCCKENEILDSDTRSVQENFNLITSFIQE